MLKTAEVLKTARATVRVEVGQILKETEWLKGHKDPFISYTRIDAIVRGSGDDVDICGPGATPREGTALHLRISGMVSPDGGATVEQTVTDEWGGRKVRDIIPLNQLPEGLIWSDEIRADYAGLGPGRG